MKQKVVQMINERMILEKMILNGERQDRERHIDVTHRAFEHSGDIVPIERSHLMIF